MAEEETGCIDGEDDASGQGEYKSIREEHINEPVKELGKWCAPAGCILLLSGALLGYCCPILYMGAFITPRNSPGTSRFLDAPSAIRIPSCLDLWRKKRLAA